MTSCLPSRFTSPTAEDGPKKALLPMPRRIESSTPSAAGVTLPSHRRSPVCPLIATLPTTTSGFPSPSRSARLMIAPPRECTFQVGYSVFRHITSQSEPSSATRLSATTPCGFCTLLLPSAPLYPIETISGTPSPSRSPMANEPSWITWTSLIEAISCIEPSGLHWPLTIRRVPGLLQQPPSLDKNTRSGVSSVLVSPSPLSSVRLATTGAMTTRSRPGFTVSVPEGQLQAISGLNSPTGGINSQTFTELRGTHCPRVGSQTSSRPHSSVSSLA